MFMNNAHEITGLVTQIFTPDEIIQLNSINRIEDENKRYYELRKLFFTNLDIYNKIKPFADPAWLSYKIYNLAKGYEF